LEGSDVKTRFVSQPVTILSKLVINWLSKHHRPKRSSVLELFRRRTTSVVFMGIMFTYLQSRLKHVVVGINVLLIHVKCYKTTSFVYKIQKQKV